MWMHSHILVYPIYGNAFLYTGQPPYMGMHGAPHYEGMHFQILGYPNTCGCITLNCTFPIYCGTPLSHILGYPSTWECIPIHWGTPVYGNALPYAEYGDAIPFTGIPHGLGMHSHLLGYPIKWGCIPIYGAPQYTGMLSYILGTPSTWECIPIDWDTPIMHFGQIMKGAFRLTDYEGRSTQIHCRCQSGPFVWHSFVLNLLRLRAHIIPSLRASHVKSLDVIDPLLTSVRQAIQIAIWFACLTEVSKESMSWAGIPQPLGPECLCS